VWLVAVDAAYLVLPVERIRGVDLSWPGSMAGHAGSGILLGCAIEAKEEILGRGIFHVVLLRFYFCIGVRFTRAVTRIATGDRLGCIWACGERPGVAGSQRLFAVILVTMDASLGWCHRGVIELDSLRGSRRGYDRGWLVLSESTTDPQLQQGQS